MASAPDGAPDHYGPAKCRRKVVMVEDSQTFFKRPFTNRESSLIIEL